MLPHVYINVTDSLLLDCHIC